MKFDLFMIMDLKVNNRIRSGKQALYLPGVYSYNDDIFHSIILGVKQRSPGSLRSPKTHTKIFKRMLARKF